MIGHPLKVRELLDEIERGEVLLPEIQRSYVWKGPQVTRLLDSIYHDYPTGQILLWDTTLLPITKPMEGVGGLPDTVVGRPKIVLDGQQRLTSLYQTLGNGNSGIKVYFNLRRKGDIQLFWADGPARRRRAPACRSNDVYCPQQLGDGRLELLDFESQPRPAEDEVRLNAYCK